MADGNTESNAALAELLKTGSYSDMTIKCGSHEAKVHKAILCSRSKESAAKMKTDAWKEGREGMLHLAACTDPGVDPVDVTNDDPDAVKLMVDFLYTHDYDAPAIFVSGYEANGLPEPDDDPQSSFAVNEPAFELTPTGDCNAVMHAKVYALGERHGIPSLQAIALGKFSEAVTHAWNNNEFPEALRWAYTATPESDRDLRDVATRALFDHQDTLLPKAEIEDCVRSISGLGYDLLKAKPVVKPKPQGPSVCGICGNAQVVNSHGCGKRFATCPCDTSANLDYNVYYGRQAGWRCINCRQ